MFASGQNRELLIINESGLYSLTLTSRKPQAKRLIACRWIERLTSAWTKTKK